MTIERIRFSDPQVVSLNEDPARQAVRIMLANLDKAEALVADEYDLTPKSWTRNTHKHNLIVDPDGTGIYRLLPLNERSGTVYPTNPTHFQPGGKVIRIPRDQEIAVIAGGRSDGKGLAIFEIIMYRPGPSPKK